MGPEISSSTGAVKGALNDRRMFEFFPSPHGLSDPRAARTRSLNWCHGSRRTGKSITAASAPRRSRSSTWRYVCSMTSSEWPRRSAAVAGSTPRLAKRSSARRRRAWVVHRRTWRCLTMTICDRVGNSRGPLQRTRVQRTGQDAGRTYILVLTTTSDGSAHRETGNADNRRQRRGSPNRESILEAALLDESVLLQLVAKRVPLHAEQLPRRVPVPAHPTQRLRQDPPLHRLQVPRQREPRLEPR